MGLEAGPSVYLLEHESGESNLSLPAEGGTILVDLIVSHEASIGGVQGKVAVDAAGVVSIDADDWTDADNVLFSYGVPGYSVDSFYDFTAIDWYLVHPDGHMEWGEDPEDLLQPGYGAASDALSMQAAGGVIDTPWGGMFVSPTSVGGLIDAANPAQTVVATLRLDVAGVEGTYTLSFADAHAVDASGNLAPLADGPGFYVTVGGE
jgi:hypothetical protein